MISLVLSAHYDTQSNDTMILNRTPCEIEFRPVQGPRSVYLPNRVTHASCSCPFAWASNDMAS